MKPIQKFELAILEVDEDNVYCALYDLTDPSMEEESGQISKSKFSKANKANLQPSSVFIWEIYENGNYRFIPIKINLLGGAE